MVPRATQGPGSLGTRAVSSAGIYIMEGPGESDWDGTGQPWLVFLLLF